MPKAPVAAPIVLEPSSILKFTGSSKGSGRESNGENNGIREKILEVLLTDAVAPFLADPVHGPAWTTLQAKWRAYLEEKATSAGITGYTDIRVHHLGGRGKNHDFHIEYVGVQTIHLEFKYNSMPQVLNLGANKVFHPVGFPEYFYDNNYLSRLLALYDQPVADPRDLYIKHICSKNPCDKIPVMQKVVGLVKAEKAAHKGPGDFKPRHKAIVEESITAYLAFVKDSIDLSAITAEFQRTQTEKHFVIYKNGEFTTMLFKPDALIATAVAHVNKNTLVTASGTPDVYHHMKLRWKNERSLMFPAWQIDFRPWIVRPPKPAKPATKPAPKPRAKPAPKPRAKRSLTPSA
jgi:hypothetical protein